MSFFLFPGQGSQTPGMGQDFYESSPAARGILERAAALAPVGFLGAIFHGTPEQLKDTRLAQTALLAVEVAVAQHLEAAGCRPAGCAGHSLGEFSALVAAGAAAFEPVFRLADVRARLMAENVPEGGMAAVIGLPPSDIEAALPADVQVANYNGPQQTIISGGLAGLEEAERRLKEAGARRLIRLAVSGPFHSVLMAKAASRFRDELDKMELKPPRIRYISSVSAEEVRDPDEIRRLLGEQMLSPVRWTDVMGRIGPVPAVEVGPGRVLQGLAKRMDGAPAVELAGTVEAANALLALG
ncbi:MAG TPA: ACP S-malonyltransferase [Candidatus Hydrogenedentes bacterium]|nr:ACP S-malonyltransferase [Candidatus Hydrogenedentota bacterium]HIJ74136.1 ACP S-malonyltransferase [Candidatus Hydrogenedentota bacterium]